MRMSSKTPKDFLNELPPVPPSVITVCAHCSCGQPIMPSIRMTHCCKPSSPVWRPSRSSAVSTQLATVLKSLQRHSAPTQWHGSRQWTTPRHSCSTSTIGVSSAVFANVSHRTMHGTHTLLRLQAAQFGTDGEVWAKRLASAQRRLGRLPQTVCMCTCMCGIHVAVVCLRTHRPLLLTVVCSQHAAAIGWKRRLPTQCSRQRRSTRAASCSSWN